MFTKFKLEPQNAGNAFDRIWERDEIVNNVLYLHKCCNKGFNKVCVIHFQLKLISSLLQKNKMAIFDELETGGLPKIEKESFKVSQANDFFGKRYGAL